MMDCDHFSAGRCRSCSWLPRRYDDQVAAKQERCSAALAAHEAITWRPPVTGPQSGFRNKAKMVVSGTAAEPLLGIGGDGGGVDLRDCGLHVPVVAAALPVLAEFVGLARLEPYDVAARRGELKYVLVTGSPHGELMVRFVLRSQEPLARIRKHLPWLGKALRGLVVVSANLQPDHKAIIEGPTEIVLSERSELAMSVNGIEIMLRPQSFFQTNSIVAASLYRVAAELAAEQSVRSVWDLYCGAGGFALHLAGRVGVGNPGPDLARTVVGVEVSAEAVRSAQATADRHGLAARFVAADVTDWLQEAPAAPDLVIVNPPRRGLSAELASWLEASVVPRVLYSSCNPDTLARDLAAMPSLVPRTGQLFDMFPQTSHAEVLVLLERASGSPRTADVTRRTEAPGR